MTGDVRPSALQVLGSRRRGDAHLCAHQPVGGPGPPVLDQPRCVVHGVVHVEDLVLEDLVVT